EPTACLARLGGRGNDRCTNLRAAVGIRDRRCTRARAIVAWNRRSRFRRSAGGRNREPFPELQSAIHSKRRTLFAAHSPYARNSRGLDCRLAEICIHVKASPRTAIAPAQVRVHFGGRLPAFQNQTQRAGCRGGDHPILKGLSFGALGGRALRYSPQSFVVERGACRSEQSLQGHPARGRNCPRVAPGKENEGFETVDLRRLIFTPIRSRFGRLRQLMDAINCSPTM